jgi:hypothetical protein
VARKGTAAGRTGEEKTGGPGGVLRCAGAWWAPGGPGLGVVPRAAKAGEKARGGGVKGAEGKGGDACAGCGSRCPGGVSSMPGRRWGSVRAPAVAARGSGAGRGRRLGVGGIGWGSGAGNATTRVEVGDGLRWDRVCPGRLGLLLIGSTSLRLDLASLLVGVRGLFPGWPG